MILASKVLKDYLKAIENMTQFCQDTGISRGTIYAILSEDGNISSSIIEALLKKTGLDFEKAFTSREE